MNNYAEIYFVDTRYADLREQRMQRFLPGHVIYMLPRQTLFEVMQNDRLIEVLDQLVKSLQAMPGKRGGNAVQEVAATD